MDMPQSLHEILGEQQSKLALFGITAFTLLGSVLVFILMHYQMSEQSYMWWQYVLGGLIIIDIIAGTAANFTRGTNHYYACRARSRWVFIAIHIHLIVVAVLFEQPLIQALYIWSYVIISACILNALFDKRIQRFLAMILVSIGLVLIVGLASMWWYKTVAALFLVKVCYAFAVDHYDIKSPT
ncbi:hypothetical protein PSECIP111854_02116 [Pseudoalteromonas sp. CIP111854]|uniref:Uncharacterized protein n=1 Tax=Pseudoalteromonas holothuriae TaxID=2963714 RepID=A0A9W4QXS1_9GAMM|nr:hypothetical protein [Pseudoalteromonas sp. CIP111854]CAH9058028.1 hypothetical protein PSECIP111854_02116 [Pseudoalteromonas sp. CIP111854]